MNMQSPQVLCLEASAGSGKTYALAKRYVQLCLHLAAGQATAIQSILAITFTNKATWAMKSRILDFLKRIALKQFKAPEVQDILGPLGLDEQEASLRALRIMNEVIRQYHYFQVQTIDSFVNILLVGCAFKIGLSARFKIQSNSSEYLQLSLDELLGQVEGNPKLRGLFEDFIRQYLFLENRSGWFPKDDLLKAIGELFRQYNTYQKPLLVYPGYEEIIIYKKQIYGLMQQLRQLCPLKTNKKFLSHLDSLLSQEHIFDVDDLSSYWSQENFPINGHADISTEILVVWRKITAAIEQLVRLEARSLFNPYVLLFENVLSCFGPLARRDDVLFLEELNRKAATLFDDELVTVEELYFRLAARFQHYLLDEFQDTSLAQWRNLALMVEEALSHGGSLFYVGDKKQAIYAFRGGDTRLFEALKIQLADFNVQTKSLEKNYRSCPEIIRFNNRVFSLDNIQAFLQRRLEDSRESKRHDIHFSQDDFKQIAATFAHAHQTAGTNLTGGLVRVVYLEGRIKQERAQEVRQKLVPLIQDLRGRFALKDIAILTRGNEELEQITQWLLQAGIPASSERSSDIKNNPLVVDLINLLTFLYSPVDNNALAQFCLGELMPQATGLGSQALQDFLFEYGRQKSSDKELYLYKYLEQTFPQVWKDFFEEFLAQAGVCPLYDLTAAIIHRFGCEQFFPIYQGFFMHLLGLVKKYEVESCSLSAFLDYYENLEGQDRFVPTSQMEAVKILTVHKAKGLEFPVVIIPFLEMDIKASSGGRDGAQAYILDSHGQGMGLVRIKESYRQFCPEIQEMYEQEYKKAFLVELNSVYVALTRAIAQLYVFVPKRVGNTVNPALFLIPEDCWELGEASMAPAAYELPQVHQMIRPFISPSWGRLQKEFLDRPVIPAVWARRGDFYHALLMHIGHINEENMGGVIENAWEKACRLFPSPEPDFSKGHDVVKTFIRRGDVRPFFYLPSSAEVFCEKEFINAYGDTKRIDRLVVLEDEVWVVDFKLSRSGAQAQHQQQVREYMALIKNFYPEHKVSAHVLYLMNG